MSTIVLLGDRATPFTEKVVRALALKKLDYELRVPRSRDEIRRWNPATRQIPVVLFPDGERMPDSRAILLRLDERFPDPPLLADDAKVAASQLRLHDWADQTLMHYWTSWLRATERAARRAPPGRPGRVLGRLGRLAGRRLAKGGAARERPGNPEAVVGELAHRFDDMVGLLGARPFFFADRPSVADLALYSGLYAMSLGSIPAAPRLLEDRPPLAAFMKRLEELTGGPAPAAELPPGGRPTWLDTE